MPLLVADGPRARPSWNFVVSPDRAKRPLPHTHPGGLAEERTPPHNPPSVQGQRAAGGPSRKLLPTPPAARSFSRGRQPRRFAPPFSPPDPQGPRAFHRLHTSASAVSGRLRALCESLRTC